MFENSSRRPHPRPVRPLRSCRDFWTRTPYPRGCLVACGLLSALGTAAQEAPRWSLRDALAHAASHSPALQARQADRASASGRLTGARIIAENPTISVELANRRGPSGSTTDRGLSVTQAIPSIGLRRSRIDEAKAGLRAAEATWQHDRHTLATRVASAFVDALRSREHLSIARLEADIAGDTLVLAERRLARGATTQIEVNLARAGVGQAERSLQQARAAYFSTRSTLARLAGADPTQPPEPGGDLRLAEDDPTPLQALVREARRRRGDLEAAANHEQAAEAAMRLALAERRPTFEVGGFFQREDGADDILGATLSVSVPIFDRNQAGIARGRAMRSRRSHQHEALTLRIAQEVATAFHDLAAARTAAVTLREQVLGTLEENVDLLQRAYDAGRIRATELMTLRRELIAGRRAYVDVLADAWQARIALDHATGRLSLPTPRSEESSS